MYLRCVCSYFFVVPFEKEKAHISVSSYGIEYVHFFQQSQHLLMHIFLTGVVAIFGIAKRLLLGLRLMFKNEKQPPEVLFLEFSQNSRENTCARISILIKLQALGL